MPYRTETEVIPGTGVVQGSLENTVMHPDVDGTGDFIGVYPFEANEPRGGDEKIAGAIYFSW